MSDQIKMPLRWLAGFGAGGLAMFLLAHLSDRVDMTGFEFDFLLVFLILPASGALGAAALLSGEMPPRRMALAAAGFFLGILAAHLLFCLLMDYLTGNIPVWRWLPGFHIIRTAAVIILSVAVGGAICGFSVRPRLALTGAHAFASGGVLGAISLTAVTVFPTDRATAEAVQYLVLLGVSTAAFGTGGALFAWRYAARGKDDARAEHQASEEGAA